MALATQTELLTAYAAGETSPGLTLLCETQLACDERSRGFVAMAEAVAGEAWRVSQPQTSMDPTAMFARLDENDGDAIEIGHPGGMAGDDLAGDDLAAEDQTGDDLASANVLAADLDSRRVPWRFRLPGLSEHVLGGFSDEKVSLLRARPGVRVPSHTHRGFEATLVLAGAMKDGERVLRRGDVSLCGQEHDHHPEIIGDETCYCLIVVDGGLRFTGALGRAFNLLSERRRG